MPELEPIDYSAGIIPAAPGWVVYFVSAGETAVDFEGCLPDPVIAWAIDGDGWSLPMVAGQQFAHRQEYILVTPDQTFITSVCGNFASLREALAAVGLPGK